MNCVQQQHEQYHWKVLIESFHLSGHTLDFVGQFSFRSFLGLFKLSIIVVCAGSFCRTCLMMNLIETQREGWTVTVLPRQPVTFTLVLTRTLSLHNFLTHKGKVDTHTIVSVKFP